ncbi:cation diffusion facilitator family transporter [Candidatus Gracilibacteria bacterium]|nr:cation diffusion facilitator family transporter [Candidatus Gracilibacteria bacterium]
MKQHHHHQSGKVAVLAAVIGNSTVTVLKFIVFFMSGSTAMFAEGVHTFADSMNQILLYVGIKKSAKKADDKFSYGYGKERFFWAILSACGIFFIGSGVTLYHGVEGLLHPSQIENYGYTYIVLILSFIIEGFTLYIALHSVYRKELGLMKSIKEADNASYAVILEDSVAVLGVTVAFFAILLTKVTGILYFDSIGSILIGILLGGVAILLIKENKSFLMGKGLDDYTKEGIIELIEADPLIIKVIDFKSEVIDLDAYIIKCEVEFNGTALMKEINKHDFLVNEYEDAKDTYEEFLRFCVDYANRIPRLIGKNIDTLEGKIKKHYPEIRHIDVELN